MCQFQYPKPPMKCTKILLLLNEKNCILYLHNVGILIYNKLVNMGLSTKVSFHEFFVKLQIDQNTYLLALQCTLHKPTLF
jgi:hypothetical protein